MTSILLPARRCTRHTLRGGCCTPLSIRHSSILLYNSIRASRSCCCCCPRLLCSRLPLLIIFFSHFSLAQHRVESSFLPPQPGSLPVLPLLAPGINMQRAKALKEEGNRAFVAEQYAAAAACYTDGLAALGEYPFSFSSAPFSVRPLRPLHPLLPSHSPRGLRCGE